MLFLNSCASIVMPTGGAKDQSPPLVINSFPINNSINVKGREIVLTMDEFIELRNPSQDVIISPFVKEKPSFTVIGKKVKINFESALKPNTTYSILFRNAIVDFNEGNALSEYRLKFSTGMVLDSQKMEVQVVNRKEKTISDQTIIALVKRKSDFFGNNFEYISKTQNSKTALDNLNKENYSLFAFVDSNQNMKWDRNEKIGFLKEKISYLNKDQKIEVFDNRNDSIRFFITSISPNEYMINTTEDIYDVALANNGDILNPVNFRTYHLIVKNTNETKKLDLIYNQSKRETLILPVNQSKKNIEPVINKLNTRIAELYRADTIEIPFNSWITRLNNKKIRLKLDTATIDAKLSLNENKLVIAGLENDKYYILTLDTMALFHNNATNHNQINLSINTIKKEQIIPEVNISIDSFILQKKSIIYMLYRGEIIKISNKNIIALKNVDKGEIEFHIINDNNKNGIWDTGDVEREIQPEPYFIERIKLDPKIKDYQLIISNP